MRIDIKDLPLELQKQALRKMAEEDSRGKVNHSIEMFSNTLQRHSDEQRSEGKVKDGRGNFSKENSKYRAKKVTLTLNDGTEHTFDSRHEAKVYSELALLEQAGEISDLKIQQEFELIPKQIAPSGKTYRNCKYIADFVYTDSEGNKIVADAKGFRTKQFIIKKKLMLQVYGIEIKEV